MWLVWSFDEGLLCVTEDKNEAIRFYEDSKKGYIDGIEDEREIYGSEQVYLAKVENNFHTYDTGEVAYEENEEGEEVPTNDTYWKWKEEVYNK